MGYTCAAQDMEGAAISPHRLPGFAGSGCEYSDEKHDVACPDNWCRRPHDRWHSKTWVPDADAAPATLRADGAKARKEQLAHWADAALALLQIEAGLLDKCALFPSEVEELRVLRARVGALLAEKAVPLPSPPPPPAPPGGGVTQMKEKPASRRARRR